MLRNGLMSSFTDGVGLNKANMYQVKTTSDQSHSFLKHCRSLMLQNELPIFKYIEYLNICSMAIRLLAIQKVNHAVFKAPGLSKKPL